MDEAAGMLQKNAKGVLKLYHAKDLNYNIECRWI